ncbi:hypothetical protein EQG49_03200 [Periweissella cryptocerci]|uniref:NEAT domain-containing protein n=1 Tax=Periweissella cryptocerci TaxID=2506420 RepID=A0A4P6YSD2_9LACO|nr:NEAT domain-containing protein [Periweissella cryptocerci]QBO35532.1 hypothetical protein EQG49_03200 [Periweissella cryptocerci]
MMQRIKWQLGLAITTCILAALTVLSCVSANTAVQYQVLKDGTQDASYASAYFVQPAHVNVVGDKYQVTMLIKTEPDLGKYPVKMQSVGGQKVSAVKRYRQNKSYIYQFSYHTKDVNQPVAANIRIDAKPINYHHTYKIGLVLAADNVAPFVESTKGQTDSVKKSRTAASHVTQKATPSKKTTKSSKSASVQVARAGDKANDVPVNATQVSSSSSSSSSSVSGTLGDLSNQDQPQVITQQVSYWPYVAIGVAAGGVLGGATVWLLNRRKKG